MENLVINELIELDNKTFVKPKNILKSVGKQIIQKIPTAITNQNEQKYDVYRKSLPIYQELIHLYHELLEKTVIELDHIFPQADIPTIVIILSKFLIPKGYFSVEDSFKYQQVQDIPSLLYLYNDIYFSRGMQISSGYGACRHVNSFICDILNEKGIKSYIVIGEYSNSKQPKEISKNNHAIIAYIDNNKYTFLDGYNQDYSIFPTEEAFLVNNSDFFIPNYSYSSYCACHYKEPFYLLPYQELLPEKIDSIIHNIYKVILQGGYYQFDKFKQNNLELYKKINTLRDIEWRRNFTKELRKKI